MTLLDLTALAASSALYCSATPDPGTAPLPNVKTSEFSSRAATFVLSETRAMPAYLRLGFTLCALAFNLLSLLTAHGLFCRLETQKRLRVITLWESLPGPGSQFTDFFRLMARFYCASKAEFAHAALDGENSV